MLILCNEKDLAVFKHTLFEKKYRQNFLKWLGLKCQSFINSTKKNNFCSSQFLLDCCSNKRPVKAASLCIPASRKGYGLCFPTTLWQLVTIIGFNSLLAHSFLTFQSKQLVLKCPEFCINIYDFWSMTCLQMTWFFFFLEDHVTEDQKTLCIKAWSKYTY